MSLHDPLPAAALAPGDRLGPYEVVGPIGAGGMGEVYRARDTRLGRDVAVKVLPASFAADAERLRRFELEARAASGLDHPGILVVHDFGSHRGQPYLVTELLEGESLRARLVSGPLPARKAVELGTQLAQALAAAHDKGIVHRDLKPDNVFLTRDGRAKILDFGLAKLSPQSPLEVDREETTQASPGTSPGRLVGTIGYVSPEQARGHPADARSDVFALGLVLYEMLTGTRAFARGSAVETLNAILKEDAPEMRTASGTAPAPLERLVRRCLEKEPAERFQSARDLAFALDAFGTGSGSGTAEALAGAERGPGRRWSRLTGPLAAAALGAIVTAAGAWLLRPPRPLQVTGSRALATYPLPAVYGVQGASDGEHVYYVTARAGRSAILRVSANGGEPVEVPHPFVGTVLVAGFSPAESALLVLGSREPFDPTDTDPGWPLWKLPVPSGAPQRVGALLALSADLSPDGRSLAFTRDRSVLVAAADGSGERELSRAPARAYGVRWAPDGKRLRFYSRPAADQDYWTWEAPATGATARALWPGAGGRWSRDGRHFAYLGPTGDIHVADGTGTSIGSREPRRLTSGALTYIPLGWSADGRRLFVSGRPRGPSPRVAIMRYDPQARRFEPLLGGESAFYAAPSPDGQWFAWVRYPEGTLWMSRLDGSEKRQLTTSPRVAHLPRWSPDGKQVSFVSWPSATERRGEVRTVASDGSETRLIAQPAASEPGYWDPCWLPDGSLVFSHLPMDARGLRRFDPRTGDVAAMPGTESLLYPKCSRQGDLWATAVERSGQASSRFRRHDSDEWVDPGVFALAYPSFTRDGRAVCSLSAPGLRVECLSLETRRTTLLTETAPLELARWVTVPWMGLDDADRPMVAVESGRMETIYSLEWGPR